MPLLQATTGFENFNQASAKVYAFHLPTTRFPGSEQNLSILARNGRTVLFVGAPNKFGAAPNLRPEMGQWTTQNFDVPEGMLVKVFVHRAGGFGQMRTMANIILRMRAQAALRRVGAILTGNANAVIARANFEGRFDVLTPVEAQAQGAVIAPQYLPSFDSSAVRRGFEVVDLAAELVPAQVVERKSVENARGEATEVVSARRRRAIDL